MQSSTYFDTTSSRTKFLGGVNFVALTLIGFEDCDLAKIYDALEFCSHTKKVQTVEVFINSFEEALQAKFRLELGLCLVKMPSLNNKTERKLAMLLLRSLSKSLVIPPIPVLCDSSKKALVDVGKISPYYLCLKSELRDFIAIFSAFLFNDAVDVNEALFINHESTKCCVVSNELNAAF